jgi:hypothetical protein
VQKLGLGLLITGVLGQLSAILWTYPSTGPICQSNVENSYLPQEVTKLDQLIENTITSIKTDFSKNPSDGLTSYADNGPHVPDSMADAVQILAAGSDEEPALSHPPLEALAHKWAITLCGLVAFAGLLLAFFARKKTNVPQWHVFRSKPGSLITLERPCLTCGAFIHTEKAASSAPSFGLWVIEIALNTPSRHRATKAIQQLELPVARRENDFVVIGPYKQKQDAARVLQDLSDNHGVRGWLMVGN